MRAKHLITAAVLASLTLAAPARADGGPPILLMVNAYLFSCGQIWILLTESLYLRRLFPRLDLPTRIDWVVHMNIVSTLVGAFLIPLAWATLFCLLSRTPGLRETGAGVLLMAAGTWPSGADTPFPPLAVAAATCLFAFSYFTAVWIEYRLLARRMRKKLMDRRPDLLRHSYAFNAISYAGLVALFFLGALHG